MTERERWTVYPLLFLSLGIGLRSHITSSLELGEISCHTLDCQLLKGREVAIVDGENKVQMLLSGFTAQAGGGGGITIYSGSGKPELILRALPRGGLVEVLSGAGVPQIGLQIGQAGGVVETRDPSGTAVRMLAVNANPGAVVKFVPPQAPAGEQPAVEQPTGEQPGEPAQQPAGEAGEAKTDVPATPEGETPQNETPQNETPPSETDKPAETPTEPSTTTP